MTTTQLTAEELAQRLEGREPLFLLDVRNAEEYQAWRIEGIEPLPGVNVPYFAFLEDEEGQVARLPWGEMDGRRIVVVCAKGGASDYVAQVLREQRGADAVNLAGGMLAWSELHVGKEVVSAADLTILQVQRPSKGCLSYMIASGDECLVVDADRNVGWYEEEARRRGWRIVAAADTHVHADHVSGGRELARRAGAPYHLPPGDARQVAYEYVPLPDGSALAVGAARVEAVAVHTPGHTPGSTCLRVGGRYLLTGDTLFIEGIGRPDLGGQAGAWVDDLYRTVAERLPELPGHLRVLPGHFARPGEQDAGGVFVAELSALRERNPLLRPDGPESFRRRVLSSMPAFPANHTTIREINQGLRETADAGELTELEIGPNRCAVGF
jgi:glyoxylase-like metal-dependent hydrolase (beta-lactamase superfamily II)/rhodanese-related sulfurtransferase